MLKPLHRPLRAVLVTSLVLSTVLVVVPIVLILLVINLLFRSVVWTIAKLLRPDLESFVTGEAGFFATNGSSKATLNIIATVFLKGDIRIQTLQEHYEQRIVEDRDPETGALSYLNLRKTYQGFLGYAFWKTDHDFHVTNHVRQYNYQGGKLDLGSPCSESDIARIIEGLHEEPWDKERSPWEFLLINNIIREDGEVCSAAIYRTDHFLMDGYSIITMCKNLFQVNFEVPKFQMADKKLSLWEVAALCLKSPYDYFDNAISLLGTGQLKWREYQREDEPLIMSLSPPTDVDRIKRIKNHFGVSYAAVIYTAIFGGIQRAAIASGQEVPPRIGAMVVLPKIGHPMKGLAVYASILPFGFSLKSKTSGERLLKIQEELKVLSRSAAVFSVTLVVHILAFFPMLARAIVTNLFVNGHGLSVGTTLFPVPASISCHGDYEISKMMCGVGTWAPMGMLVSTSGSDNKQILNFSINNSVFKSRVAAQNLGIYVTDEIQSLWDSMEKIRK